MNSIIPVQVYAEMTPNPATLKFVASRPIINGNYNVEYQYASQVNGTSPLAEQLFMFPFVKSLLFSGNYVAVTRVDDTEWDYIMAELREFIQEFLQDNEWAVIAATKNSQSGDKEFSGSDHTPPANEIEMKIISILDQYVKPAVERDGGAIVFRSFTQGRVVVAMKGACSGCPSATMTLKSGIEYLLKEHVAEVTEVEAERL